MCGRILTAPSITRGALVVHPLRMASLAPFTAAAKHVAETSGDGPATVAFGLSDQILESVKVGKTTFVPSSAHLRCAGSARQ